MLAAASFGPSQGHGEYWYAADRWPCLPEKSLVVGDRQFWAANVLIPVRQEGTNRHWLMRAPSRGTGRVVQRLGPRDELVEMQVSPPARAKAPGLPTTWMVRVIPYQHKGFRPQSLITSLLDPVAYPAAELVALYHERCEIELGYDDVKTEMLASIPLRSKPLPPARRRQRQKDEPCFDLRTVLHALLDTYLTQIQGLARTPCCGSWPSGGTT